jgi:hypothetical protein
VGYAGIFRCKVPQLPLICQLRFSNRLQIIYAGQLKVLQKGGSG